MTALIGNAIWSQGGRTPQLPDEALFHPITLPFVDQIGAIPIFGSIYRNLISGHDIVTYFAFALAPLTYWALYSTRFGLRLRAVGENPAAVDTAGISVRALRYSAVLICGVLVGLVRRLSVDRAGRLFPAAHERRQGLHRARRAGVREMAAVAGAGDVPVVRLSRRAGDPHAGRGHPGDRTRCRCRRSRRCPMF